MSSCYNRNSVDFNPVPDLVSVLTVFIFFGDYTCGIVRQTCKDSNIMPSFYKFLCNIIDQKVFRPIILPNNYNFNIKRLSSMPYSQVHQQFFAPITQNTVFHNIFISVFTERSLMYFLSSSICSSFVRSFFPNICQ